MNDVYTQFAVFAPRGAGALGLAMVGVVLAIIAQRSSLLVLNRLGFDQVADRVGFTAILRESNIRRRPSRFVATIVFYALLALTVVAALYPLGLNVLAQQLDSIVAYVPRVVLAVLLLLFGVGASRLIATLAERALVEAGITRTNVLSSLTQGGIIFVALILAAAVLRIDVTILVVITFIVLGGMVLAAALAVGLGLRGLSRNIAANRYIAEGIVEGDRITIGAVSGIVERIGYGMTTVLAADGRRHLVPNAHFMEQVVHKELR